MVVRNIKFPLKMKNEADVRSLEELQENADIESIMEYYCNGKLKKWCNEIKEMKKSELEYQKREERVKDSKDIRDTIIYSSLNKGEVFEFGEFEGKKLKWKVLDKKDESIYVLCETIICEKAFCDSGRRLNNWKIRTLFDNLGRRSNNWKSSTLRKWLNEEFYNKAFDEDEKKSIKEENSDKVTLLSKEEAEGMMTQQERNLGSSWWLRSACPNISGQVWLVCFDGSLLIYNVYGTRGVRPALNLKL